MTASVTSSPRYPRRSFHFAQDLGRDFLRSDLLAADLDPGISVVGLDDLVGHQGDILLHLLLIELTADEALDSVERVFSDW